MLILCCYGSNKAYVGAVKRMASDCLQHSSSLSSTWNQEVSKGTLVQFCSCLDTRLPKGLLLTPRPSQLRPCVFYLVLGDGLSNFEQGRIATTAIAF
eukprot:1146145-Pelagomonas_calceolata.AAC.7